MTDGRQEALYRHRHSNPDPLRHKTLTTMATPIYYTDNTLTSNQQFADEEVRQEARNNAPKRLDFDLTYEKYVFFYNINVHITLPFN